MPKYIFVFGGVFSGLGKGIVSASLGKTLQEKGFSVTAIKIDPYVNCDAGTLRPTEHGEVFVTEDGGEIDEDMGHYERFLNIKIPKKNNITTGQVYKKVIEDERKGVYLGKTVQLIPHITNEIKKRIKEAAKGFDFAIVEIGGTVGDFENTPFLYSARRILIEGGDAVFILVTYLPVPAHIKEMKTKPTQHAIKNLLEQGISPSFIVARGEYEIDEERKRKIYTYSNVHPNNIISCPDVKCVYEVPLLFEKQDFANKILKEFGQEPRESKMEKWKELVTNLNTPQKTVKIAMVGKYVKSGSFSLPDSYISINHALIHAGAKLKTKVEPTWIDSCTFDEKQLKNFDGIIVPGGFGSTGVEGKVKAIKYARENKIPFLGLCFGFQLAVVEYARNVCKLEGAHTTEVDSKTKHPVICILPEQRKIKKKGGTMRLGGHTILLDSGSKISSMYKSNEIKETFRHRYEINPEYIGTLTENGLIFSGKTPNKKIMYVLELPGHPFFIGVQYHPEFMSRFESPHPLFCSFIETSLNTKLTKQSIDTRYSLKKLI